MKIEQSPREISDSIFGLRLLITAYVFVYVSIKKDKSRMKKTTPKFVVDGWGGWEEGH
jgi:hypothetical protein